MPVKQCQDKGEPGFKWGDQGKCYTYSPYNEGSRRNANKQAIAQGLAIGEFKEGVPHYTKDGKLYKGPMHKDADGKLMTGAIHTKDSEYLYHEGEFATIGEITCEKCGWKWNISDGGNDPYICHKCGYDNQENFATIGERGGIKKSDKAPNSDTPNKNPQGEGTAKGSASSQRGAEVSKAIEENLQKKSNDFNERYKDKLGYGVNLGMLKSVYQRGVGAYNVSHSPAVKSSQQWALGRVNAFLYMVRTGRPENKKYVGDFDLLPKGHPKSDKNGMAGVRVSFDYDDTLTTKKGLELLRKELDDKNIIYIISARQRKSGMLALALRYNISGSRVFATGSNQNKVDKLKELGISKHYDNSQEVIDIAKDKPGLTTKVIKV